MDSDVKLVQTSTSLDRDSVLRDGLFLIIAKLFGKKTIVFFRGWDQNFVSELQKKHFPFFRHTFLKSDALIVLSSRFKTQLLDWGYKKEIYVETTVVDGNLIKSNGYEEICNLRKLNTSTTILFLARVEKEKGLYECINTFHILNKKFSDLKLVIAGDGFELENAKVYVENNAIKNVEFTGHVVGEEKRNLYINSHLYFFPSYTEGMPNTVLEAMAFGLPIITRPVGGLIDILEDGVTGYMTESLKPQDFELLIMKLLSSKELMATIGFHNYTVANQKFIDVNVVERLETIFTKYI